MYKKHIINERCEIQGCKRASLSYRSICVLHHSRKYHVTRVSLTAPKVDFPTFQDLTGKSNNRLTAMWPVGKRKGHGVRWLCLCNCGTLKTVFCSDFNSGGVKSCGCLAKEVARRSMKLVREQFPKKIIHGLTKSPEHAVWSSMKHRCSNPNSTGWKSYGGRGIKVCDSWRESFESFYADMGPRPTPSHSLDRIDVNGNYCPENCRWATKSQQNSNQRKKLTITNFSDAEIREEYFRRFPLEIAYA